MRPWGSFESDVKRLILMSGTFSVKLEGLRRSGKRRVSHARRVYHGQAREITIETDPPQHILGDGEPWGDIPITVKVVPLAIRFLVAGSPEDLAQEK